MAWTVAGASWHGSEMCTAYLHEVYLKLMTRIGSFSFASPFDPILYIVMSTPESLHFYLHNGLDATLPELMKHVLILSEDEQKIHLLVLHGAKVLWTDYPWHNMPIKKMVDLMNKYGVEASLLQNLSQRLRDDDQSLYEEYMEAVYGGPLEVDTAPFLRASVRRARILTSMVTIPAEDITLQ